jgi:hypothetical protein
MNESDTEDPPPSTQPTPDTARREGRQAERDGKGAESNPYVGPNGDPACAREWARGFVDGGDAFL